MTVLSSCCYKVDGKLVEEVRTTHWGGDLGNLPMAAKSTGDSLLPR